MNKMTGYQHYTLSVNADSNTEGSMAAGNCLNQQITIPVY